MSDCGRRDRRGSSAVVDTFLRVHADIALPQVRQPHDHVAQSAVSRVPALSPSSQEGLDDISGSTEEMLTLFSLARGLSPLSSVADAGDAISKHLKRLVPSSLIVFYIYDSDADELVAAQAVGEDSAQVVGLRVAMGERLSGWVAAHRQPIRNSDPILDFGESARTMSPRPRSCLSVPLSHEKWLVGVLSLYSANSDAFSKEHQRIAEIVARQVSPTLLHASAPQRAGAALSRDTLTGLPRLEHYRDLTAEQISKATTERPISLLRVTNDIGGAIGEPNEKNIRTGWRSAKKPKSCRHVVCSCERRSRRTLVADRCANWPSHISTSARRDRFASAEVR